MNEHDERLLRAAARAIKIDNRIESNGMTLSKCIGNRFQVGMWNPLESTDEALHLAATLDLNVTFGSGSVCVNKADYVCVDDLSKGLNIALCRAIVQAAAHLGGNPLQRY